MWLPRQVLDDGRKSYVLFPMNLAVMPAPMVRLVGPNGFELVNARQVGTVMVLDHLFNVAELRLGTGKTAETVRIVRQAPRTIACPGDPAARCGPRGGSRRSIHRREINGPEIKDARSRLNAWLRLGWSPAVPRSQVRVNRVGCGGVSHDLLHAFGPFVVDSPDGCDLC